MDKNEEKQADNKPPCDCGQRGFISDEFLQKNLIDYERAYIARTCFQLVGFGLAVSGIALHLLAPLVGQEVTK